MPCNRCLQQQQGCAEMDSRCRRRQSGLGSSEQDICHGDYHPCDRSREEWSQLGNPSGARLEGEPKVAAEAVCGAERAEAITAPVASSAVNPALATRLEAFSEWKASKGYETVTSAQFRRFMGAHRPNSVGSTLYANRSGFADWRRLVESTHGNTSGNQLAWLYRLETSSGDFLKWGVSGNPATRYPAGFMEGKRLIPIKQGPLSSILQLERSLNRELSWFPQL